MIFGDFLLDCAKSHQVRITRRRFEKGMILDELGYVETAFYANEIRILRVILRDQDWEGNARCDGRSPSGML